MSAKPEAKTTEPASLGPTVESVPQYIDEYSPEVAMRMMQAHIRMAQEVRKGGAGRWEVPHTHRHLAPPAYRFVRLGTMSDVKRRDAILRQRFILEQMGWKVAPAGTRNSLYLTDGDQGVYLMIAEPAAQMLDEHERQTREEVRRRRFGKALGRLPEDLRNLGAGIQVDSVDVQQGRMSINEFRKR